MGKSQTQTSTTSQQSQTSPWAAAQPLLQNLINSYSGQGTGVTGGQSAALGKIGDEAGTVGSFDVNTPISNLLSSSTAPQVGMLSGALNKFNSNLATTADPNNVNPYDTPGFSDALHTMTNDITNSVKGVYAGSGRDPSGAGSFAGSLARGLTQGEAPVIAGQFNANRAAQTGAAQAMQGAAMNTAGAITGQNQVPLANAAQALGLIPTAATAAMTPGTAALNAANMSYMMPYTNLSALLQPSVALGSMGSQSTGSGTSTQEKPESTFGNIMGGITGGVGLLSQMGAFGGAAGGGGMAAMLPMLMMSDERVKDDTEEIGQLHDGQKVYRFRYKGDPTMRIGLLAQEVAKREPSAVAKIGPAGMLAVEHGRATDRAAAMGRAA